ncbi:hypothetical protein BDU57DRAFT_525044 [Ampelomyces quisqualis]|uniref:Uncharacterized protein n=1 Tax=Ampelomyces quisqualis TaxID=50730 RepID=A0A6A5Q5L6_AMPQU|nr:hypothetical protein BDU57DRAFT_525044 [Ampelomyces quisqualis]
MAAHTYPFSPETSPIPPDATPFGPNLKDANGTQPPATFGFGGAHASPTHREHLEATYNRRTIRLMAEEDFFDMYDATALELGSTPGPKFLAALAERVKQRTSDIESQLEKSKLCMLSSNLSEEDDLHLMNILQETSLGRSLFIIESLRNMSHATTAAKTTRRSGNGISKPRGRCRPTQQPSAPATNTLRRSSRLRNMKKAVT